MKKKKIIIAICLFILAVAIIIGGWYLYQKSTNKWDVKQDNIVIEYGEDYEPKLENLIDVSKYPNITEHNTSISFNPIYENNVISEYTENSEDNKNVENENSYIAVGTYEIEVTHKIEYKLLGTVLFEHEEKKTIKLDVKDTIAPVLDENNPLEIEVTKNCNEEFINSLADNFKATDLSEVTISIEDKDVDYTTAGEYTATIQAIDKSNNASTQKIKIKIVEPTIELDKTKISLYVGESSTVTATVKGKSQDIEWTSSDPNIVTVENGNLTAKAKGTATITAKANEVEASVTVSVTNKSVKYSGGTSNSSTSSSTTTSTASDGFVYSDSIADLLPKALENLSKYRSLANEVLTYTNQYREEVGAAPLSINETLMKVAMVRALDISYGGTLAHKRPNGEGFGNVLTYFGLDYATEGENIAWGQSTPRSVTTAWRNSETHYKNMIKIGYSQIGIGVSYYNGRYYWVQVFGG